MSYTIIISISAIIIFLVYFARYKTRGAGTFLFSKRFLEKADEILFGVIKFIFKMYSLLFQNIIAFLANIPHASVHAVHKVSHSIAQKTHDLVEKIKKNKQNK